MLRREVCGCLFSTNTLGWHLNACFDQTLFSSTFKFSAIHRESFLTEREPPSDQERERENERHREKNTLHGVFWMKRSKSKWKPSMFFLRTRRQKKRKKVRRAHALQICQQRQWSRENRHSPGRNSKLRKFTWLRRHIQRRQHGWHWNIVLYNNLFGKLKRWAARDNYFGRGSSSTTHQWGFVIKREREPSLEKL